MRVCLDCACKFESRNDDWKCPDCGRSPRLEDGFRFFASELAAENDGMPGGHAFEGLFEREAGNFWFRARNELIVWAVQKYFPHAKQFLEIGCGTAYVLNGLHKAFPSMQLHGSEIYHKGLSFARQRVPEATLIQMDARRVPYSEEFDLIGSFDVLEHIENDTAVLAEMHKALRPGGGIILTVPQHRFLWSYVDTYSHHVRRYERAELKNKVEAAGFEIVYMTSFVSLLLPPMAVARMARRNQDENFDPHAEFNMSGTMNKALETVMGVERGLIKTGVSFPMGGSLLLLARAKK